MKKIKALSLLCLFVSFFINAQTTITVDNSVGADADYDDLQNAIDNAAAGDVLYVHASEISYGNVTINKPLAVIGYSHSDPEKKTTITTIDVEGDISDVTIKGLHFTSYFEVSNNSVGLQNLILENNKIDGIIYFGGTNTNNILMRGNVLSNLGTNSSTWTKYTNAIITNNIFSGRLYVTNHESVEIKNNLFLSTGNSYPVNVGNDTGNLVVQDCIFYREESGNYDLNSLGVVYENCLTYNPISTVTPLNGSNNIDDQDPLFIQIDGGFFNFNDDYNLQAGSPATNAGVMGNDVGLFGNSDFIFNNSGFTAGIPTVNITAITSQVAPGNNIEVTIESNSN